MGSMGGVVNTFSTQTSMAVAPINRDRKAVNARKRQRLLSEPVGSGVGNSKINSSGPKARLMLLTLISDLKVRPPAVFRTDGSSGGSTPHPPYGSGLLPACPR